MEEDNSNSTPFSHLDVELLEEPNQQQHPTYSATPGLLTDLPSSFSYQTSSILSVPSYFDTQTDALFSSRETQPGSNKRSMVEEEEDDDIDEAEQEVQFRQQHGPISTATQATSLGTQGQPSQSMMGMIEETILSLVQTLALCSTIELPGFGREKRSRSNTKRQRSTSNDTPSLTCVSSRRPLAVSDEKSAKKLARYLAVLDIIHEALASNVIVSKRDIFYRDVELFGTQAVVNKIIDDISCVFNVPRSSLNVTAASKGLLFGPARLQLKSGKSIDCSYDRNTDDEYCSDEQGILIPPVNQIAHMECNGDYVLIVEKEASFRHLVSTGFNTVGQKGILITGRGYPDIATRHMVKYIADIDSTLPVLALVDNDPHGLDIFRVYKWGSRSQSFDAPNLAVPTVKLLGLTVKDRTKYGFSIPSSAYRTFSDNDRRKAIGMLFHCRDELQHYQDTTEHQAFITEIQKMLHMNVKCELQALCTNHQFGMFDFIRNKLQQQYITGN